MLELNYQEMDSTLLKFSNNQKIREKCELLRRSVVINSNLDMEKIGNLDLRLKVRTLREKILLGILSWYFPEEIRYTFNLELEANWGAEHIEIKRIILLSKRTALGWLAVQDLWSTRDFFGNILKENNLKSFLSCDFYKKDKRKVIKPVFRRGFNDKGSLRPSHLSQIYDYKKFRTDAEQELIDLAQEDLFENLFRKIEEYLFLQVS